MPPALIEVHVIHCARRRLWKLGLRSEHAWCFHELSARATFILLAFFVVELSFLEAHHHERGN